MNDWDGVTERRQAYITMEQDIRELKDKVIKIPVLEERIDNWMESTKEYRKDLCNKMDNISDKLDTVIKNVSSLPCPEQKHRIDNLEKIVLTVVVGGIVLGLWIRLVLAK